jgi:ABC-type glycerol-3-phosphate transport system substrate-binding protein
MKRLILLVALVAVLVAGGTVAGVAPAAPTATITFSLSTSDGFHPKCILTITSSKDISHITVNGVKTDVASGTTQLVLNVKNGDVITVKSGITTATYTVTGCLTHGG